jgi:transforming growth factor-beta-induced protein
MKKQFRILAMVFLSLFVVSCDDDNDDNALCCEGSSIVDIASQTESLSTLVAALQATGLDAALTGEGPYTVLAPTNDAFDALLVSLNATSLDDIPVDVLTNVLLNHVIAAEVESSSLTNGYASTQAISTASGTNMSIYINTDNGVTFNGVSNVTAADIAASNGVVHIVDSVIGLPSVVTFALADPNFDILVQALTREDLTQDFVGLLSTSVGSPSPFTVFAPINSGFVNLLAELGVESLAEIPEETLAAVLSYHVVAEANQLSMNLSEGMEFTTVQGGNLQFGYADNGGMELGVLTDNGGRTSNIVAVDVQADNGIIHAIDTVVLP